MTIAKLPGLISACSLIVFLIAYLPASVYARQIDDVSMADTVTIEGTSDPLQLNGMGYRTKFVFDVYILGFYTEEKVSTRNAAQALTGPKRIHMHLVRDVSREKMSDALVEGFEKNTSKEQLEKLGSRIKAFTTYFPDLNSGDVVILDYLPETGTRVIINGAVKGTIEGKDFYTGLLDIWLGKEPADEDLKDAMLDNVDS